MPSRAGDEIGLITFRVERPTGGSIPKVRLVITESPAGIRFANIGEIHGFNDNSGSWCPTEIDISNILEMSGPDYAKDSSGNPLWQQKCTINVSRVANISTISDSTHAGHAIIDVRTWKKGYPNSDLDLDIENISIAGNLSGRVYGGAQDNASEYLSGSTRAQMREIRIGSISAAGVIGRGTARPADPAVAGGNSLQIGQAGYAFLVEATTIDSITGSTVNIYADTTINQSTSLTRRITQIRATGTRSSTSGQEDVAGVHGMILADRIAPISGLNALVSCDGDLSAAIKLGDGSVVTDGQLAANTSDNSPSIVVGRNFRSGALLQTDTGGLKGQVVVNNQSASGSWSGAVTVGSTTISHDSAGIYPTASAALGDGAVGLVPFRNYPADCDPISIDPTSGTPNVILDSDLRGTKVGTPQHISLAFFGPVRSSHATRAPFDVLIAIPGSAYAQFMNVTDRFDVTVRGLDSSNAVNRIVDITGRSDGSYPQGIYLIRQNSTSGGSEGSRLLSDVPGTPEVPAFNYWFQVRKDCNDDGVPDADQLSDINPESSLRYDDNENGVLDDCEPLILCTADFNSDDLVDDADFVTFVAAYNILDCTDPAMPSGCPADLNFDDAVDDADFVLFALQYDQLVCP